jgi:hypothetical protein
MLLGFHSNRQLQPLLTCIFIAENFHHLYALLSELKVGVLDGLRKDAKQKYNDALKSYVTQYFGRPLEKLNVSHLLVIYFQAKGVSVLNFINIW